MTECGKLNVPVDYRKPQAERFDVAVVRARATGPGTRIGALFFNPGGPGASGVDAVTLGLDDFAGLRQRFDIVSLDPRGVGLSNPVVCDFEPQNPPSGARREAFFDAIGPAFLNSCVARSGRFSTQVTTANAARDIDAFRAALREPKLTYFAVSYGTILGASYAALFPARVRAMVLDAALPPEWFNDFLIGLRNEGAAAGERTLRRIDQLCRADAACPLRHQGVIRTLDQVVATLNARPVTSADGAVVLDGTAVLNAAVNAYFYDETQGWPDYVAALAGSAAGDHSKFLMFLQDAKAEGGSDNGDVVGSAFYSVLCSDSATRLRARDYLPAFHAADVAFPHFGIVNPSSFTGFFTPPLEAAAACAAWPRNPPPPLETVPDRVEVPIVLIGNEYDHSTTWDWTRRLAKKLGAEDSLIHYEGGGHTIYGSSPCVDEAVDAYLSDLEAPPPGLSCAANPVSFGPQTLRAHPPRWRLRWR
jgi:pimeloyl-ACP methyl ester carboxylesterase